ncbi:hypothetical protein FJZ31_20310 [Candidatus Poribacteria bacterium]|nr:hypothetical protein [Candidatus Poribacteria bacterium]
MHALAKLLLLLEGHGLVMAAVDDLLYPCFTLGCHGLIAALLTAVPELCVSLWNAVKENRHDDVLNLHNWLLRVWLESTCMREVCAELTKLPRG